MMSKKTINAINQKSIHFKQVNVNCFFYENQWIQIVHKAERKTIVPQVAPSE
jgi:hypothetical protein